MVETDEKTNEASDTGKKPNTDSKDDKKDMSELDKLKASNDVFEKELIRGRELKAESQKLEAEKMLGGTAGGHVESKVVEETPKEYNDRINKEISDGKHNE